jgi:hypothetical protein
LAFLDKLFGRPPVAAPPQPNAAPVAFAPPTPHQDAVCGSEASPGVGTEFIWSSGAVLLDDFVVDGELGQGGMGTVYSVHSRSTGHVFAVKTVLAAKLGDATSQKRFLDELQTWIDLPEHPHLVTGRFFRTVGDRTAIFADLVEGGSLQSWIRERRLTGLDQILDVAAARGSDA